MTRFQISVAVVALLMTLAFPRASHAQVLFLVPTDGGAHTAPGDVLRGQGKMLEGRGAYLRGLGEYQQGAGQYLESLSRYQLGILQAQLAAEEVRQKHRESLNQMKFNQQALKERKAQAQEVAQIKQKLEQLLSLRDRPTTLALQSGVAMNFLIDQLGSKAESAHWRNVTLHAEQLGFVRWQPACGLSQEELATKFDAQGHIAWPRTMLIAEHNAVRTALASQLRILFAAVSSGRAVDPATVLSLRQEITKLMAPTQRHHNQAKNVAAAVEARQFMTELSDVVKKLGHPASAQLFDGTLDVRSNNATELMDHLSRHNLRFAPTSAHGTAVYAKLHAALAATHRDQFGVNVASR